MTQQVLFPGWNKLSLEQKSLGKKWIKSILKVRIASENFLNTFSPTSPTDKEPLSNSLADLLNNLQFEVVDSFTSSEGIQLQEIIPRALLSALEDPRQDVCQAICRLSNNTQPSCVSDCIENYTPFF